MRFSLVPQNGQTTEITSSPFVVLRTACRFSFWHLAQRHVHTFGDRKLRSFIVERPDSVAPKLEGMSWSAGSQVADRCSRVAQTTELFFDFSQERTRPGVEGTNEPAVVNDSALVDHDLTLCPVCGYTAGKQYAQEVLPRKPGCT